MSDGPTLLELCIRHIGILTAAYIVYLIAAPHTPGARQKTAGGIAAAIIGVATGFLMNAVPAIYLLIMLMLFFVAMGVIFRYKINENFTLTLISCGISYAFYFFSSLLYILLMMLNTLCIADRFDSKDAAAFYLQDIVMAYPKRLLSLFFIIGLEFVLMILLLRSKRIRKGLEALIRFGKGDVGVYISIALLSVRLLYSMEVYTKNDSNAVFLVSFFLASICFFVIYFWIKKEIKSVYISRNQENELAILEKSLDCKEKLIGSLRADNERLAELIHKDNKLIPSMVMAVRKAASGSGEELSRAMEAADSLAGIYAERAAALHSYESHAGGLPSTGSAAVDAVLLYMSEKAAADGVTFRLKMSTDITKLIDGSIERSELNVMLADLAENAVLSAKGKPEAAVQVSFGETDGIRFVEVLDSGPAFEASVLSEMGKKRITTRPAEGGSGIGLMTLFRILKSTRSTLEIEEFAHPEEHEGFSKAVRVIFDSECTRRLITYRGDELKKTLKGRFELTSN
jgi:Signal transduction histidine kinase regulating C4-dicarboxylate transport system